MDRKWEISGKGRNSAKYGYYMLLIIAAARRTRSSQWSWSFNCPLPSSQHWEHGWRTSPGSRYLRTVDTHYHSRIQQVKSNFKFREAVQFIWISKIKTPSPIPETGFYDPSICSPFWLIKGWTNSYCISDTICIKNQADGGYLLFLFNFN